MASESINTSMPDIIQIRPVNDHALRAFDKVARSMDQNQIRPNQVNHIRVTGESDLNAIIGGKEDSSTDTSEYSPGPKQQTRTKVGYFGINFDIRPASETASWAMGKAKPFSTSDTANASYGASIDILLAISGTPQASHLLRTHAYISLHPQSSAWMLSTWEECKHTPPDANSNGMACSHHVASLDHRNLGHGDIVCLSRSSMTLLVGLLCYEIRFCISTTPQEIDYLEVRFFNIHYALNWNTWLNTVNRSAIDSWRVWILRHRSAESRRYRS